MLLPFHLKKGYCQDCIIRPKSKNKSWQVSQVIRKSVKLGDKVIQQETRLRVATTLEQKKSYVLRFRRIKKEVASIGTQNFYHS
ncbi:hypothetical protein Ct9H90mP29_13230 [bacterium]|nr:MAG: hypothetical protein Ct9H90mP29_13230 [bacterium]